MVKKVSVADYIKQQLEVVDITQREVARLTGFSTPNNISMIKEGASKLPINRIPAMARALKVDPAYLLRLTLSEYMPETWAVIESLLGKEIATESELKALQIMREASGNIPINYADEDNARRLGELVEKMAEKEAKARGIGIVRVKHKAAAK